MIYCYLKNRSQSGMWYVECVYILYTHTCIHTYMYRQWQARCKYHNVNGDNLEYGY